MPYTPQEVQRLDDDDDDDDDLCIHRIQQTFLNSKHSTNADSSCLDVSFSHFIPIRLQVKCSFRFVLQMVDPTNF